MMENSPRFLCCSQNKDMVGAAIWETNPLDSFDLHSPRNEDMAVPSDKYDALADKYSDLYDQKKLKKGNKKKKKDGRRDCMDVEDRRSKRHDEDSKKIRHEERNEECERKKSFIKNREDDRFSYLCSFERRRDD